MVALVVGWALLPALADAGVATPQPEPTPRFGDEIAVRLVTVVARVVDGAGNPVLGLAPVDFRVRVGRQEVPVAAVDWVSSGEAVPGNLPESPSASPSSSPGSERSVQQPAGAPAAAPGKLVVIFVQADANAPSRTRGHLHTLPFTRELLAALQPEDRVAVVSFDSHLKLWQDFSRERATVPAVIYQAIHFGGAPYVGPTSRETPGMRQSRLTAGGTAPAGAVAPELAAGEIPSLARSFDFDAARRAASPERALAVTADALAALPGEKVLVFLAWGLGSFSSFGTQMTPAFAPAVRALAAARTTVFVLDVTEADSHDLEVGLRGVADATGGTYDKTNLFPALAVRQLARTISGYYLLTLDTASLPRAGGSVEVELRGRRGNVLLRPTSVPAGAGAR